ncbi:MAG: Uma2 family endonuclease [Sulfuriferula sp.]|nr:Uma2 family endonuclease [Sulfuriferula sp.]
MAHAHVHDFINEDDYLQMEAQASVKHELVGGDVYAMAGASERHNRISLNIAFHLRAATRGKPCRAFMADMKLRVDAGTTYYYPDVMMVCDVEDDHYLYKRVPCLIAEVLSPATANVDLREKWLAYRSLPSLHYYLLVDAERLWAKVYSRGEGDVWYEQTLSAEDALAIDCADLRVVLTLDDIYEDTGLLVV